MNWQRTINWSFRFFVLFSFFIVCFVSGSLLVVDALPDSPSEPGLVSGNEGLLIIALFNTLLVMALLLSSRWNDWKLALLIGIAYYGAVTFLMQIETWYFLSSITVGAELLPRLFLMGIPVAFLFIPLAVWVLGKGKKQNSSVPALYSYMSKKQCTWKLMFLAILYLVLYWFAGYFIAWQNPELRSFYGSPGEISPFWQHILLTWETDPVLFLFQIFRGLLWSLIGILVLRSSMLNVWWTALLVGLLFSLPQNLGHIVENPLLPLASIRLSHLIETTTSTFVFGMIAVWLLHRQHSSIKDLLGLRNTSVIPQNYLNRSSFLSKKIKGNNEVL